MTASAPSRRELRLAGTGLGLGLSVLAAVKLVQHRLSAPYLVVAAAVALLSAAFVPTVYRPMVVGGRAILRRVVWLVTRVALLLVFYAVVTPIAVIGRLFGARFSDSDFSKKRRSYWIARDERPREAGEYEQQY